MSRRLAAISGQIRDTSAADQRTLNHKSPDLEGFLRADAGIRTPDPFITSEVLYQLSYVGALQRAPVLSAPWRNSWLRWGYKIMVARCSQVA